MPRAIGPVAGQEAGPHPRQQLIICPRSGTRRSGPSGIEVGSRDPERLAQSFRRPDFSVCRDKGERHCGLLREVGCGRLKMLRSVFNLMASQRSLASFA